MKKVVLISAFSLALVAAFAQSVVINSPANLAGALQFGTASGWGADLLSNVWTADAVMLMDEGADPTDGCDTVTNKQDLAGKIVLVNRGMCNFSLKALQAQDWGGIACIIVNNTPSGGVVAMGGGTYGPLVTIPAVMISYEDGQRIKAEMANGPVNISIGNIRFDHDIATNNRAGVCHAPFGAYPSSWIRKIGDFAFTPGADITNRGNNIESGCKVTADIAFAPNGGSPTSFYNKSSDGSLVIEVDSTRSAFLEPIDLFGNVPNAQPGRGTIQYSIASDTQDDSPFDNAAVSEFYLSDALLSKARLQSNLRDPFATSSYQRADGTNAEYITGFRIPYGSGCKIDSILFFMSISAPATLAGLTPEALLYGWDDADGNGGVTNSELSYLALGTMTFDAAETRTGAVVRIALEDFITGEPGYTIPADDIRVFVGVRYSGSELPFFGFDEGMDYLCNNAVLAGASSLTDSDLPYVGITGYDPNTGVPDVDNAAFSFTSLNAGLSASLVFSGSCITVGTHQLPDDVAKLEVYPNPTTEILNISVQLKEPSSKIIYAVMDPTGRTLYQYVENQRTAASEAKLHVDKLPAGSYLLQIMTDKGYKQRSFQVVK